MPKIDDGGPAFPYSSSWGYQDGASLRDVFAMKSLQGLVTRFNWQTRDIPYLAELSYKYADAMIAERKKGMGT